ncbi:MAG: hypothetical protein QW115_01505 [Thermoplasmata archaeon]
MPVCKVPDEFSTNAPKVTVFGTATMLMFDLIKETPHRGETTLGLMATSMAQEP